MVPQQTKQIRHVSQLVSMLKMEADSDCRLQLRAIVAQCDCVTVRWLDEEKHTGWFAAAATAEAEETAAAEEAAAAAAAAAEEAARQQQHCNRSSGSSGSSGSSSSSSGSSGTATSSSPFTG